MRDTLFSSKMLMPVTKLLRVLMAENLFSGLLVRKTKNKDTSVTCVICDIQTACRPTQYFRMYKIALEIMKLK